MAIARAITRNALYIFVAQVTQKLAQVVFVIAAARLLGAEGYGTLLLVTTMVLVVTAFANFGIRPLIVRLISRERERTDVLLGNVLVVRAALAVLAYGILVGFVHVADYGAELRVLTFIAGTSILFNVVQDSLEAVLLAHQRMKLLGGLSMVSASATALSGTALLWAGFGLRWVFAVHAVIQAGVAAATAALISRRIVRFHLRFESAVVRALLIGCVPFLAAFLLGFMDTKVDVLMLSWLKGPLDSVRAIGYYGPAHTILMATMLLPRSLNQVLVPVVSQKIYREQALVREVVEGSTKFVMLAVSFPIVIATTLFSGPIVGVLFGAQYAPTAPALSILGWAYGFYAVNLPSHSVLGSSREMRYFIPVLAGTFSLNVSLNYLLIPRYSYLGAALGSVIVLAAGFACRFYFLRKIIDLRLSSGRPYLRLLLVLVLTLAVGFAVRPRLPWPAAAAVVALAYGGLLHLLRAMDADEWRFVLGLLRRRPVRAGASEPGEPPAAAPREEAVAVEAMPAACGRR